MRNFNSHAHVERDKTLPELIETRLISTHTLTWSVTTVSFVIPFGLPISTHTLTWSVTGSIMAVFPYKIFQLTRSRGA